MAALIDEDYLRETFNIHKDVADSRITPYIAVASRRLQKWVGAANYADNALEDELKIAEGTLTMHFLVRNLNTNIRTKGLVGSETVEGNVTVRYLNPAETLQAEGDFLRQAEELINEFIEASDLPATFETVADEEWQT